MHLFGPSYHGIGADLYFKSRHLDYEIHLVVLDPAFGGNKIEIYALGADEGNPGLEQWAGHLTRRSKPALLRASIEAIERFVKKYPLSAQAKAWLNALDYNGLLVVYPGK